MTQAGLDLSIVRGVIPLDGSNFDIPDQLIDAPKEITENTIFGAGTDPVRQRALSPTIHAASPNAGAFLILQVQRPDGIRQGEGLAAALKKVGTDATVKVYEGEGFEGHMEMLARLGDPTYPATPVVDAWLKRLLK